MRTLYDFEEGSADQKELFRMITEFSIFVANTVENFPKDIYQFYQAIKSERNKNIRYEEFKTALYDSGWFVTYSDNTLAQLSFIGLNARHREIGYAEYFQIKINNANAVKRQQSGKKILKFIQTWGAGAIALIGLIVAIKSCDIAAKALEKQGTDEVKRKEINEILDKQRLLEQELKQMKNKTSDTAMAKRKQPNA